ncbi:DUF6491 family protein [Sphingomonas sp.]|uniref:DUF6491 family protein n=1 Tax=Sphingomonas sp. TaxID=28214 RepID=UPI002EDA5C86
MLRKTCFLLSAFLVTASAAPPAELPAAQQRRACFWPSAVTGFSPAGRDRALIHISVRETWELALASGCPDVNWAQGIGIRPRAGERVCTGRPAELLVPNASGRGFQRCLVRSVRKLGPAEAAAARGLAPKRP